MPALEEIAGPDPERSEGRGRVLVPDLVGVEGGQGLGVGPGDAPQAKAVPELAEH